jgi:SsrA-binding protein
LTSSRGRPVAKQRKPTSGDVATNRRARHKYELLERFECGIQLTGTEVKSLREGRTQIGDAYAIIEKGEVWLRGAHIPPYGPASTQNHDPERPRKLLLHRYEIERLVGRSARKGLTLIPTRIYFKGALAKVELALATGKQQRDRRREIRDRDVRREVEREDRHRLR